MKKTFDILEKQIIARSGSIADCEDAIFTSDQLACVIDGASSKSSRLWDGLTGGQIAATLLMKALSLLPSKLNCAEAIHFLTEYFADFYKRKNVHEQLRNHPQERCSAAIALFNAFYQEIWIVGDCQFIIDGRLIQNPMKIDQVLSEARALYLNIELLKGKTVNELLENDTGRKFIDPLLKSQWVFQNTTSRSIFAYGVIDGFNIPDKLIKVIKVADDYDYIVLASDGYPFLKPTLQESESMMEKLLSVDPLGINQYNSLSRKKPTESSFDDRSFLKIQNRKVRNFPNS